MVAKSPIKPRPFINFKGRQECVCMCIWHTFHTLRHQLPRTQLWTKAGNCWTLVQVPHYTLLPWQTVSNQLYLLYPSLSLSSHPVHVPCRKRHIISNCMEPQLTSLTWVHESHDVTLVWVCSIFKRSHRSRQVHPVWPCHAWVYAGPSDWQVFTGVDNEPLIFILHMIKFIPACTTIKIADKKN